MRLYFEMVYVDGLNESGGAGLGIADRLPLLLEDLISVLNRAKTRFIHKIFVR